MGMAGAFDPIAARKTIETFATMLNQLEEAQPATVQLIRETWKAAYLICGHKALGRLMIGKAIDEACKSFER